MRLLLAMVCAAKTCTTKPKKDDYVGCVFSDGGPLWRSRKQLKLLLVMKCAGKAAETKLVGRSIGHMSDKKDWQDIAETVNQFGRNKGGTCVHRTSVHQMGKGFGRSKYEKIHPEMDGYSDEESDEEEEEEEMEEKKMKMKVRRRKKRPIGQRIKVM
ncbi:hypothetical protein niasHT_007143 [Heterodera trifolii]|uniref:Uncharacterized protein n=1 Tax=Heterodera trifolii TaxID=157864 RepID=A0ABD2LL39_9BILA